MTIEKSELMYHANLVCKKLFGNKRLAFRNASRNYVSYTSIESGTIYSFRMSILLGSMVSFKMTGLLSIKFEDYCSNVEHLCDGELSDVLFLNRYCDVDDAIYCVSQFLSSNDIELTKY